MMATVPHVTSGLGLKISGRWIFVDTSVRTIRILPANRATLENLLNFLACYVYILLHNVSI